MVDLGSRLEEIKALVADGAYFTINRARQYGKTTILNALANYLSKEYLVVSMDFQAIGNDSFQNEAAFSRAFAVLFLKEMAFFEDTLSEQEKSALAQIQDIASGQGKEVLLIDLFSSLMIFCKHSSLPILLMIDEVDSAANNQVFLDFLAQLRNYYLDREKKKIKTFQSVILAGVYDVKNLKRKIRPEEGRKFNSPWNIAADFKVSMSFTKYDIAGMLREYESDHHTGMPVEDMAGLLYDYTSGYPFLVSRLCKLMDEHVSRMGNFPGLKSVWTKNGFFEAERMLLAEKNTLFESFTGKLLDYPELNHMLKNILFTGSQIIYNADQPDIDMASMLGFIINKNGLVAMANRIFETRLYNLFLSEASLLTTPLYQESQKHKSQFIADGNLDMRRILEKFVEHFHDIYRENCESFIEKDGRKLFLLYLRPIINGTGNYYIEAQTRDLTRTDVIVDYRGKQYIIEMKIWHGEEYHKRGERQLAGYLDAYHASTGYLLSFCFNKKKETGIKEIIVGDKILVEAVV